jgi:hypothetical protein
VGEYEVEAYLQGLLSLPPVERDLLAMAGNELIDKAPRIHAPFSDDLTTATQGSPGGMDRSTSDSELSQLANDQGPGEDEHGKEPPRA